MARTKRNFEKFRAERASELERLAQTLERANLVRDVYPIRNAVQGCRTSKPKGKDGFWGYNLDNLIVPIGPQRGTVPDRHASRDFLVDLSVNVVGKCLSDNDDGDPFRSLGVDIVIRPDDPDGPEEVCAFHLDRDLVFDPDYSDGDAGAAVGIGELHPIYHFQFGGHRLKSVESRISGVFFPAGPRLKYPPMEAFLAVDFVFANFNGDAWKRLREIDDFVSTLRKLQRLFWRPYLQSLGTIWIGPRSTVWPPDGLWPQVCPPHPDPDTIGKR